MKIFTYGIDKRLFRIFQYYFKGAKCIDVTEQYQDILALSADIVVISEGYCSRDVLEVIKKFENETKDIDNTIYIYLTLKQEMKMTEILSFYFGEENRTWYLRWILTEL